MKIARIAAAAALFAVTTFANAGVTFDPNTGTGFVGKGDVQLAFGWNNAQLQTNAAGVGFSYQLRQDYVAVCTFTTGDGTPGEKTHNVSHTLKYNAGSTINYDARTRSQITGFNLTGYPSGTEVSVGTEPVIGAPCPGNEGTDGTWSSVTPVGTGVDGLFVTYGGAEVRLSWPAPVL
ncbi:MAG: hypothetical protein ACXWC2_21365 [Ramlibacter sp.]